MGKTPLEKLKSREITLPPKSHSRLIRLILKVMQSGSDVTYKYSFDKDEMKGRQVILLADHATKNAYKYVLHGYPYASPNVIIGYPNIFVKGIFGLLLKGGIIPKKLYQADPRSILDMLKVLKLGGSLCIFPEGMQAAAGSTHPVFPGTANLIKKAGVAVVLCKSYGSYLVRPRYKKKENKGHQEYHYELLFTEEEIKELSVDQIYDKLIDRFRYNDFEWNKTARNKYYGKDNEPLAKGIEAILYRCPKCGAEFCLKTEGEDIICEKCNNTVTVNEYFDILPKTESDVQPYESINEWFRHQRKLVMQEVQSEFCYEYECEITDLHTEKLYADPFYPCGEGKMTITNDLLRYVGTRHGEQVELEFDIKVVPSFYFTPNLENNLFYQGVYYGFRPKQDKRKVVKYMMLVEESHRLVDDVWNKISEDVYN